MQYVGTVYHVQLVGQGGGGDRVGSGFGHSAHPHLLSTHMQTCWRDLTLSTNDLISYQNIIIILRWQNIYFLKKYPVE